MGSMTERRILPQHADLTRIVVVVHEVAALNQPSCEGGMIEIDACIEDRDRHALTGHDLLRLIQSDHPREPLLCIALRAPADRPRASDRPRATLRPCQTFALDRR